MATSSGESFLASDDWASYNNKQLVKSCPELMTALYENMHYYMYAIANSSALNGYAPGETLVETLSWWQVMLLALVATTAVAAIALIALYSVFELRGRKRAALAATAVGGDAVEHSADAPAVADGDAKEANDDSAE